MGCSHTTTLRFSSIQRSLLLLLSFLCVLTPCLLSGWLIGFQTLIPIYPSASTYPHTSSSSKNVTILLWYWPFHRHFNLKGDVCWDLYSIPRCRLTDQRSMFPSADVVVFHNRELVQGRQKLPVDLHRPQGQKWAWMSLEAPLLSENLTQFDNQFNMTITFRRDADITVPYGELLPRTDEDKLEEDVPQNKSFLVCWVISNYKSEQNRSRVYKELSDIVPVKVYGSWTKRPLISRKLLPTISRCYFYLAFENSDSKDYITEKLWRNAYQSGAVPVVMGPPRDDYEAVAPRGSFVHVDDFKTSTDLGKYLQQVAEDKRRYGEYFSWKRKWKVRLYKDWRDRLCRICSQYHRLAQHKVYSDLEAWVNARST